MIGGLHGVLIQAALVVFIAAGAWYHGYGKGSDVTRAEYAQRDLQAATEAQDAYARIVERYRAKEQAQAKQIAAVSAQHQKDLIANEKALDIALSGSRLFDRNATNNQAGGSCPAIVAGNPVATDTRGTELSREASDFLRSEAARANRTVIKLNLCIDTLEAERR